MIWSDGEEETVYLLNNNRRLFFHSLFRRVNGFLLEKFHANAFYWWKIIYYY